MQLFELVESVAVHWFSCSVENKRTVISILVWNELGPFFLELFCKLLGCRLPWQKLASRLQSHVIYSIHGNFLTSIRTHRCLVGDAVLRKLIGKLDIEIFALRLWNVRLNVVV